MTAQDLIAYGIRTGQIKPAPPDKLPSVAAIKKRIKRLKGARSALPAYTEVSTVYIEGPPVTGENLTMTKGYGLYTVPPDAPSP